MMNPTSTASTARSNRSRSSVRCATSDMGGSSCSVSWLMQYGGELFPSVPVFSSLGEEVDSVAVEAAWNDSLVSVPIAASLVP